MELLDICLTTTYFQSEDKFYQQKEGKAVGKSLSPVVSNVFMEHFEEITQDTAGLKPAKWFGFFDDTCQGFATLTSKIAAMFSPPRQLQI
jgi:hypothetical protein